MAPAQRSEQPAPVAWPKGSLQWALLSAAAPGCSRLIRHRRNGELTATHIETWRARECVKDMDGALFSLGWEPCE